MAKFSGSNLSLFLFVEVACLVGNVVADGTTCQDGVCISTSQGPSDCQKNSDCKYKKCNGVSGCQLTNVTGKPKADECTEHRECISSKCSGGENKTCVVTAGKGPELCHIDDLAETPSGNDNSCIKDCPYNQSPANTPGFGKSNLYKYCNCVLPPSDGHDAVTESQRCLGQVALVAGDNATFSECQTVQGKKGKCVAVSPCLAGGDPPSEDYSCGVTCKCIPRRQTISSAFAYEEERDLPSGDVSEGFVAVE